MSDVADYLKWAHAVVYRRYGAGHDEHDDYVSEMMIAMWRAEATYDPEKGSKASWLTRAAELRLGSLAGGKGRPFGHESSRQRPVAEISWDGLPAGLQAELEPQAFDPAQGAMIAYHRGEIALAMRLLTEAQRRATVKVITDELMTGSDRAAWSDAKPKLRAELAHLDPAL